LGPGPDAQTQSLSTQRSSRQARWDPLPRRHAMCLMLSRRQSCRLGIGAARWARLYVDQSVGMTMLNGVHSTCFVATNTLPLCSCRCCISRARTRNPSLSHAHEFVWSPTLPRFLAIPPARPTSSLPPAVETLRRVIVITLHNSSRHAIDAAPILISNTPCLASGDGQPRIR
jgi:hypothetical protein